MPPSADPTRDGSHSPIGLRSGFRVGVGFAVDVVVGLSVGRVGKLAVGPAIVWRRKSLRVACRGELIANSCGTWRGVP